MLGFWRSFGTGVAISLNMKKGFTIALLFVVIGCGKKEPQFSTPQDGASYTLPGFGAFTVTLADNDYNDTTIEFRGLESLSGRISCQNATNGPATCTDLSYSYNTTTQNNFSRCTQASPCYNLVAITARRGDVMRTIFIRIVDVGYANQGRSAGSDPSCPLATT